MIDIAAVLSSSEEVTACRAGGRRSGSILKNRRGALTRVKHGQICAEDAAASQMRAAPEHGERAPVSFGPVRVGSRRISFGMSLPLPAF